MKHRVTSTALFALPTALLVTLLVRPAWAAPDAPSSPPRDDVTSAAAPATAPSVDAPAGPPDAPASRPSTDAPADAPAGPPDAAASLPPPADAPAAGQPPAPEVKEPPDPADPDREASSKEAGTAVSGEIETVGDVDSERVGKAEKKEKSLSHYQTGGVSVSGGWGFYGVVPYTDGMFCGEFSGDIDSDSGRKSFCTNTRGVAFMEFGGFYGAHPRLDIVLNLRLNMMKRKFVCKDEDDPESCQGLFNDNLGIGLFPGIRGWISKPEDVFKIGAAIDFVWMHENFDGYRKRPLCQNPGMITDPSAPVCPRATGEPAKVAQEADIKNDDVGVRIGLALQVDPHHNIGIFVMPTARMGFLRWFEFAVDIQLGIQARFP